MELEYIAVRNCEEVLDIVVEDGVVRFENLQSQWPLATGLKYKNMQTGRMIGILKKEGKLHPPQGGWEAVDEYVVSVPSTPAGATTETLEIGT